jgi:MFS family permease
MQYVIGDGPSLPTGLVFASFMLSMSIGGMLFGLLLPYTPGGAETLCVLVYLISAIAMTIPILKFSFWWVYISFLILEAMVGMFNSCGATLRSRYYPENVQSTIMSIFRLPLNLLVVFGTILSDRAKNVTDLKFVFAVVVGMHLISMGLQLLLTIYCVNSVKTRELENKNK